LEDHRDDVWRFLVAAVGRTDADDCFQETFMAAMRAYPRLRPDSNLRAWVLTIAHRKALDTYRARARHAVPVEEVPEVAHHDAEPDVAYAVVDTPVGKVVAAQTKRGLASLGYVDYHGGVDHLVEELSAGLSPRILEAPARLDEVRRELDEYFEGRRHGFDVPID